MYIRAVSAKSLCTYCKVQYRSASCYCLRVSAYSLKTIFKNNIILKRSLELRVFISSINFIMLGLL